jgi:hypothetical protein
MSLSNEVLPRLNMQTGGALPNVSQELRPEQSLEDWFVVSRFTRRAARGALSTQEYWRQMRPQGGAYVQAADTYKSFLDQGKIEPRYNREARDYIAGLPPEQRAYAILEGHFDEEVEDLHPLNRARQVVAAMADIRRDMHAGQLARQESVGEGLTVERIVLAPSTQRIVNEVLEDIAMREHRNALIVLGHPGWKQKTVMGTDQLWAELRAAAPQVADELAYRLRNGRNKVYAFNQVRRLWPQARDQLLARAGEADVLSLATEADIDEFGYQGDAKRVTGPKLPEFDVGGLLRQLVPQTPAPQPVAPY